MRVFTRIVAGETGNVQNEPRKLVTERIRRLDGGGRSEEPAGRRGVGERRLARTPTQGGQRGTPKNLFDLLERLGDLPVAPEELRVNVLENNAPLVERTARIAREMDRSPATTDEMRETLGLRGREKGQLPASVNEPVGG